MADPTRLQGAQNSWLEASLNRFYPQSSGWIDGITEFHRLIESVIPAGVEILEIGSGPPNPTSRFLRSLGTLTVDIDPDIQSNDALDVAHVLTDDSYPVADATIDACVSDYVIATNRPNGPPGTVVLNAPVLLRRSRVSASKRDARASFD